MRWPGWLGVGERRWKKSPDEDVQPAKTAWDWLQLLIVPAILAAIAVAFNAAETSRDRSREDRRTREDRTLAQAAREDSTLNAYLNQMSDLMLKQHLLDAGPKSAAAIVARTITLVTIGRLDGERKVKSCAFFTEHDSSRDASRSSISRALTFTVSMFGLQACSVRHTNA